MPSRTALARCLSILGHPLLVLPTALLVVQAGRASPLQLALLVSGLASFALVVLAYSRRQVRRGRWAHVDASGVDERRRLNRFLLVAMSIGALLAWATRADLTVVASLLLCAAMVGIAMLVVRLCTLSLHVAFAVFAALLVVRTAWWAGAVLLACAAAIAWSRLALGRHVPRDVLAGAVAGAAAGAIVVLIPPTWQA